MLVPLDGLRTDLLLTRKGLDCTLRRKNARVFSTHTLPVVETVHYRLVCRLSSNSTLITIGVRPLTVVLHVSVCVATQMTRSGSTLVISSGTSRNQVCCKTFDDPVQPNVSLGGITFSARLSLSSFFFVRVFRETTTLLLFLSEVIMIFFCSRES